jgi:hypothetical protein
VLDLQVFCACFGGFLFVWVRLAGVRFAEFGTRLGTRRCHHGATGNGGLPGPVIWRRGWDLPQGTDELDNRLVPPGGELFHGAAEMLCLLA